MARTVKDRFADAYLTPVEERIRGVLLDGYPQSGLLSARLIAANARVSPASVTRFAVKLGYENFAALQTELKGEILTRISTPPGRLRVQRREQRMTPMGVLRAAVEADIDNMRDTIGLISEESLVGFVDALHRARRVFIIGSKKAQTTALYMSIQLRQIRAGVRLLETSDELPDHLLDMSNGDLLIAFEPRRATRTTRAVVDQAKARNAVVVVICDLETTGYFVSADYVFPAFIRAISFFDSYAAIFALCNALAAALIARDRHRVAGRVDDLEQLNQAFQTWVDRPSTRRTSATRRIPRAD